ncbi:nodulation protein NfeD [Brevibacterium sp. JNUCC-42]|nr:nodulation protein NfeD [Brevibacterium sp. JNUCC-42]
MRQRLAFTRMFAFMLALIMFAGGMLAWTAWSQPVEAAGKRVFYVPVEQDIERGLESFLRRAIQEANEQRADVVILDINTPGGDVVSAGNIGALIRSAPMKVIAYINNQAFSAGTYIALNANEIVMEPGSSIGAAAPIDVQGNAASIKITSGWAQMMEEAAKLNGRDASVAKAMVFIDEDFAGLKKKGEILSLGAEEAQRLGYADKIVRSKAELFQYVGVNESEIIHISPTPTEKVARFVTNPVVLSCLLLIGMLGVIIELFAPGFGVAGIIGILSFTLYFFGHFVAGFANWLDIGLFIIGVILMILEIFLPGGIVGFLGFASMSTGLVLAAYDTKQGLTSLGIAAIITLIVAFILAKYFGMRGTWSKFVLKEEQHKDIGYVAPKNQNNLLGKTGVALTTLRPAGVILIDEQRIDAVSVGGYVTSGSAVKVVQVEGARIVVQEWKNESKG